jgi:RNA polymerase-interacting CarD/CdnL/TRCF family regulator
MTTYERILEALLECTSDPAMGLDKLQKSQIETIAEIVADIAKEITKEQEDQLKEKLQDFLDNI